MIEPKLFLHTIVVLPDGETWSVAENCSLCIITDAEFQQLCDGKIEPKDLNPVKEIIL